MSLYAKYIQERENKEIIENDVGFVTYFYIPQGVYIQDIYVAPEHRKQHMCFHLADQVAEIAKEKGIKKMFGTVSAHAQNATDSLKVLLAYGMKLDSCGPAGIVMVKEI